MQFSNISNLSRYDSQQLNYASLYCDKSEEQSKKKDAKTQLDQLLIKIADMYPDSTLNKHQVPTPQKVNIEGNIKSVTREGKPQDEAHKPSVLETNIQKKIKNKNIRTSNLKANDNKQISPHKNNQFYKFWTDEMVRLNNENNQLKKTIHKNIQQIEKHTKENENLSNLNQKLTQQLNQKSLNLAKNCDQFVKYKQQINQQNKQFQRKMQIQIQNLKNCLKVKQKQIENYKLLDTQRLNKIQSLLRENKIFRINQSNTDLVLKQNRILQDKINKAMQKIQIMQYQNGKKSEEVRHLWKVKEVEYENIMNLVSRAKKVNE